METYELTKQEVSQCLEDAIKGLGEGRTLQEYLNFAKSNVGKLIYHKLMYAKIENDHRPKIYAPYSFTLRDGSNVMIKTICDNDHRVFVQKYGKTEWSKLAVVVLEDHKFNIQQILFGLKEGTISGHIEQVIDGDEIDKQLKTMNRPGGSTLRYIDRYKEPTNVIDWATDILC